MFGLVRLYKQNRKLPHTILKL